MYVLALFDGSLPGTRHGNERSYDSDDAYSVFRDCDRNQRVSCILVESILSAARPSLPGKIYTQY